MLDQQRIQMVLVQPGEKPVASSFILIKVEKKKKTDAPRPAVGEPINRGTTRLRDRPDHSGPFHPACRSPR